MNETEVKILEIAPEITRKLLRKNNAEFIKKVFQKNFFYENESSKSSGITVRLRKEGDETILTVKERIRIINNHKVRKEHETKVSFEAAKKILKALGFKSADYIELKREYWKLKNCSVEICEMPKMPVYLELEGSETSIKEAAGMLGYGSEDYFSGNIMKHYKIKEKTLRFTPQNQ